jgi:hypothetical protein
MLRTVVCSLAVLALLVGGLSAADKKADKPKAQAGTVKAIDEAKSTLTVTVKKEGQESDVVIEIKEGGVKLMAGKEAIKLSALKAGDKVQLVLGADGKPTEVRKAAAKPNK